MFINPMWDTQAEREGKQKCTPLGYRIHVISDLLQFIGLILFVVLSTTLLLFGSLGSFQGRFLWLFTIPLTLGVIGAVLYRLSWRLALNKGYHYDRETRVTSWMEDGEHQTFEPAGPRSTRGSRVS